tara:strand:- start:948 stop:1280 length:333 start_codon:yes stop_codon:yes gene_type:complete
MIHMIDDNIEAYRRAVADTAKARTICQLQANLDNQDNLRSCIEEEQLRLDGLKSVIGMAIREAAAEEPHNPFAINGDVNQPVKFICNNGMFGESSNDDGSQPSPPPPRRD